VLIVLRFARGPRVDGPGLAELGQLALLAAFWSGNCRFLQSAGVFNATFGMGGAHLGQASLRRQGLSSNIFLELAGLQSVLLAPILAIVIAFGEEYGWRGYLQTELFKLGRVRGVLLVGVIWGVWHWPLILMGFSYPGHPLLGMVLTVFFTTGLAIVLGYAVLRSGSILLAAYLHALNDQVVAFIVALGFKAVRQRILFWCWHLRSSDTGYHRPTYPPRPCLARQGHQPKCRLAGAKPEFPACADSSADLLRGRV